MSALRLTKTCPLASYIPRTSLYYTLPLTAAALATTTILLLPILCNLLTAPAPIQLLLVQYTRCIHHLHSSST